MEDVMYPGRTTAMKHFGSDYYKWLAAIGILPWLNKLRDWDDNRTFRVTGMDRIMNTYSVKIMVSMMIIVNTIITCVAISDELAYSKGFWEYRTRGREGMPPPPVDDWLTRMGV